MQKPTLSICIPTYNRASCLRQCLESIVCQFDEPVVAGKVEIVISDNASEDDSESVVKEFQSRHSNIGYRRNEQNYGVDRNILQVVAMASGEYVWLMGDDDALFPDALAYVLPKLEERAFKYGLVNCWGYDNSLTAPALKNPNLPLGPDMSFPSPREYMETIPRDKRLVGVFCGLSVQIFERSIWEAWQGKESYIGSNAIHFFILLASMRSRRFAVLRKPLVKVRADNIRWNSFAGWETIQRRNAATRSLLVWVLNCYGFPHSRAYIELVYYRDLAELYLKDGMRKWVFRSQHSRDWVKRLLGKL